MHPAIAAFHYVAIALLFCAPTAPPQISSRPATAEREAIIPQSPRSEDLPIVRWPVKKAFQRLYPDRVVVLDPTFHNLPGTRWDLALTYSGTELEALDAGSGRPVWPRPIVCPAEPTLLRMDESRLIFITHCRVFALMRASGVTAWQVGDEPPDDPDVDPESVPWWTDRFMTDRHLYVVSSTGELICIDPREGSIRWRRDIGKDTYNGLIADDRFVYYAERRAEGNVVNVLDAESGERVRAIDKIPEGRVDAMRTLTGGTLVVIMEQLFVWIDAVTGKSRGWFRPEEPVQLSTVQCDATGLFMASNRGSVLRIEITNPVLGRAGYERGRRSDQTWTTILGDDFYVAWDHAIVAFDPTAATRIAGPPPTGDPQLEPRWRLENISAFTHWPPLLTADAILTIEVDDKERGSAADTRPASSQPEASPRFRLRGFRRADGKELQITRDGPLRTGPLKSFGGLAVRDNALILLDGNRLIGYVGGR